MSAVTSDEKRPAVKDSSGSPGSGSTSDNDAGSFSDLESHQAPETGNQLGSVEPHIFTNPARAEHWRNVYEKATYEGRHRFDPSFTWSAEAEKKLVRKLDWKIMAWVWVMFSSLDLVRRNINRAVSDNMLGDLKIDTNDYNTGQTIYLVAFLAAELPGGLISKKVGPFRYTPAIITLWGIMCAAQAGMSNRAGFFAFRAVLGVLQGGFIPEMVLYLSYYYKSNELPVRLSVFYTVIPLTQTYGALLAAGILEMRGVRGWAGWQWLFLIEGLLCVIVGAISFFVMSPSVSEPARAFRRPEDGSNKWWSAEDEKILINRILRDDPTKGDMNNRTAVTLRGILRAICNKDLAPIYLVGLLAWIPFQPTSNYMSLILRGMGYSVFESNMLAIPGYILFAINVLALGWLSERVRERSLVSSISNIWMLIPFIALVLQPVNASPWVRYVLITLINSIPYAHSILVGMVSRNAKGVGTRAVALAVYNITYQLGSIAAVNVYREEDKPNYYKGNTAMTALCGANILGFIAMKLYYIRRNRQIDSQYAEMSEEERSKIGIPHFVH